ncbi:H+transporting two-sector ATPase alpha/beta subunit central region [Anaeromyxobacter sp. K]|uniref:V-type ATP synthase alpha chain n=1 Tax=Anaeromyxobacter sp. (strain K) TaxID=447217 RepID=VATA_ANASK|nr:V-type ATP synthase subunit A [Anaeromyxobacter sp. K]B4UH39.1 RecName: Full=V-type ATP synthase alpha chain; AltName: Full=V-ATPase subunit A [Anaeromyxobacter sp. K]ACG73893.1 H+transporting two-sector ATPase alpha/beta subunit central region [Anaeromyxobacter sp. K]
MSGTLMRMAGPTVVAEGLSGASLNEVVRVGEERLLGEIIRIEGDRATIQVYEETAGLALGEPVEASGEPLAVELGPGLLGSVFDGVQRPLSELAAREGDFLGRGASLPALDRARAWEFEPAVAPGDRVEGGARLGVARAPGAPDHLVVVPPGVTGRVSEVRGGARRVDEPAVLLDGGATLALLERWPVRRPRPARRRLPPDVPFLTGQRVLDCFFPVSAGGTAVVPGGFGTGKTVLEQSLAKWAAADVVVYVGCGERGNEMSEVLDEFPRLEDPRTGGPLLARTVMIVNTSNMPVAAREASIYTGCAIAEYFRDMGRSVALMIDSTSRWAEALREISARLEEMPGEEGYPTYLASRLARFYERAGRVETLGGAEGAVTMVGAVSPPGGDLSEPVTQCSLRATGALWALSADLAHRRHYPAVDWSVSFTLEGDRLAGWFEREAGDGFGALRDEARKLLQRERELAEVAELVGTESLQDAERLVLESARLLREGFLRQSALDPADATCPPAKAFEMLRLFLEWHRRAGAAVGAGVPLRSILDTGLGARLLRLAQLPAAEVPGAAAALRADLSEALARLEAE